MKQATLRKLRRYFNTLLGFGKPRGYNTSAKCEPSSNNADTTYSPDYRTRDSFMLMRNSNEVITAGGAPGAPGIQYCSY